MLTLHCLTLAGGRRVRGAAVTRAYDDEALKPLGPRLDVLKLNRRVEDVDGRVDVVEVDD